MNLKFLETFVWVARLKSFRLTADKLFTTTYTALKQYKALVDLQTAKQQVERYRDGLEQVIKASMNLFEIRSLRQFANGLLHQIASLFHVDAESLVLRSNGLSLSRSGDTLELIAGLRPRTVIPGHGPVFTDAARALDGADMDEHVLAAVARLDEAKSLRGVEPLHCTCSHLSLRWASSHTCADGALAATARDNS